MQVTRVFRLKNQLNRAKAFVCITLFVLLTLFTVAGRSEDIPLARSNQGDPADITTIFEVKVRDEQALSNLLGITRKIVSTPRLYAYLNEVFKDHLTLSDKLQKEYGWPDKIKGLSETQILFLLQNLPNYDSLVALLEKYLKMLPNLPDEDPNRDAFVNELKKEFQSVLANGELVASLKSLNDPSKTLTIGYNRRKGVFSDVEIFFNHPTLKNPSSPKLGYNPAADLKKKIIDTLAEATQSVSFNVFEFNLMDVADAIEEALKRGVKVTGGVDEKTTILAPENIAVANRLSELQKKFPGQMKLTLVDSTGLNHQKIFVIDGGTADAKVIFSSGNLTQSCIGPEGDAVKLAPQDRPKVSIPNSNHIVVFKGALPSIIVEHELHKTLIQKLRGQKGYPISGSYSFTGNKIDSTGKIPTMGMAFSPNGGMGDVSASIIRPLLLKSMGQIFMMQFVASAPVVLDTIIEMAAKDPRKFDFKFVGDPPFAMQSWSIPLLLSVMDRDAVTKRYFENKESPLLKILTPNQIEKLRNSIRLNPKKYGEFHYKIEGESLKITVKLHHKVFILPRIDLAIIGTSFNPSASAEGNQEQFLWLKDHPVVQQTLNAFMTEFIQSSTTVTKQTLRRNKYIIDPTLVLPPPPKQGVQRERFGHLSSAAKNDEAKPEVYDRELTEADLEAKQAIRDSKFVPRNKCVLIYGQQ